MSRRRVAVKSLPKGGKPRYRSAVVRGVKTLSETDASRRRLSTQNVVFSSAAPRKTLYGSESGCRRRRRKVFGSKFLLWVSTQLRTSKSRMQWLWGSEHGGREEACGLRIRSVGSGLPLVVFSGGRETDTLRFPFVGRLFVFQAPKNRPVTGRRRRRRLRSKIRLRRSATSPAHAGTSSSAAAAIAPRF